MSQCRTSPDEMSAEAPYNTAFKALPTESYWVLDLRQSVSKVPSFKPV